MMGSWVQTPVLRRLLFVLGNLMVGVAITYACVVPTWELFADREHKILHQQKALVRLIAVAAREGSVQSRAREVSGGEGEFLTGKTDGAVGADLQARLKGMVESAGAKLRSVRALQPRTDSQMRYTGSHVELSGPIAAVHQAVHAIESAKPYLFVISGTIRLSAPVGQVGGVPQEPVIEAQLDVFGAMRIEGAER